MSVSDLARRSDVSRAKMIRILKGKDQHYSVSNLHSVLVALGMTMELVAIPADEFKDAVDSEKAQP